MRLELEPVLAFVELATDHLVAAVDHAEEALVRAQSAKALIRDADHLVEPRDLIETAIRAGEDLARSAIVSAARALAALDEARRDLR